MKDILTQKKDRDVKGTEEELEDKARKAQDPELDQLWQRVRDAMNDATDDGTKKEYRGTDKPTRLRFSEAIQNFDTGKPVPGVVSLEQLESAFVAARLNPPLTKAQISKLVSALEAWY